MSSTFKNIDVEIYGESHAPEIGVIVKNLPQNESVDLDKLQLFLNRRKGVKQAWSTQRIEEDKIEVLNGLECGKTTAKEFKACIKNNNVKSSDYSSISGKPRPSHADYAAYLKNGGEVPIPGGGKFSGRMTAPMCIAGGIAKQILEKDGIIIHAYVKTIGGISANGYMDKNVRDVNFDDVYSYTIPNLDGQKAADDMTMVVEMARAGKDSVGGIIECVVLNMTPGIGDALYDGLEGRIAQSIYAIPAVKGVEFGAGFALANMYGSDANDSFIVKNGKIETKTNNAGGINGGISNGMPICLRVAIRPTPSIAQPQNSVDIAAKQETTIEIQGRHDACIVPRAIPVVEAAVALALLDAKLDK